MRAGQVIVQAMAVHYSIDLQGAEEFLAGMIEGLIQKDDLSEIQKCMTEGDGVADQVEKIINEIAKGDLPDVIAGVTDAYNLIQKLPQELEECKDINDDLQRIESGLRASPLKRALKSC